MLAAITLTPRGDGVAVVAKLLHDALTARTTAGCTVVTMFAGPAEQPSFWNKADFAARVNGRMLLGRPAWMLFSHMNLARTLRYIPRRLRAPYAVFLHGTEVLKPVRAADRALLCGAALRLANSEYTARGAMQANPEIGPVIACPLALPGCAPGVRAAGTTRPPPWMTDPEALVVLTVGALRANERYKGHDQLIDAWPVVVAAVPKAHLVIAGDGDDAHRIRERVEASTVGRSITLLGFVPDQELDTCYRRAVVFALPSRGEGFGLVYLEAMAHQLPCLGSRQDAAGEVIQDGVTGLLVDQHDTAGLASALVSLLSDRERRAEMGRAGQLRLRTTFSVPAFCARLDAALQAAFPAGA